MARPMPRYPMVQCLNGSHPPFNIEENPNGCPAHLAAPVPTDVPGLRHRPVCANDGEPWPCAKVAALDAALASPDAPHRHRYGLMPVWTADGTAIDSWWWCTDHPTGEWVRIEDDPDAAYAIPPSPDAPRVAGLDEAWAAAEAAAPPTAVIRAGRSGGHQTRGWATAYDHGEHLETVFAATLPEALRELAARLSDIGDTAVPPTSTEDARG